MFFLASLGFNQSAPTDIAFYSHPKYLAKSGEIPRMGHSSRNKICLFFFLTKTIYIVSQYPVCFQVPEAKYSLSTEIMLEQIFKNSARIATKTCKC